MARNLEVNNQENDDDTNSTCSSSDNEMPRNEEDDSDGDEMPDLIPRTTRYQEELERMNNGEVREQNNEYHIDNIDTVVDELKEI